MRTLLAVLPLGLCFACSSNPTVDAGIPNDSGTEMDAGVDAGPPRICLPDSIDAGSSDAGWDGGYVFSCKGRAPTPGGQAELVVSGIVTKAGFTRPPLADIKVELLGMDGGVLATTTSDDAGTYRLTFDAGCEPLGGEVRATHPSDAGYYVSYSAPASPWIRDRRALELFMFDSSTATLVAALAGVTITDGGVLALHISDCDGNAIEGATVSTGGVGAVRYVGPTGLPSSALTTTSSAGDVLIFNLPGNSVDVSATLDGGLIGQRIVPIHPNAVLGSSLSP